MPEFPIMPDTEDFTADQFVVWSVTKSAWLRAARQGFTTRIDLAGRYSAEEAVAIENDLRDDCLAIPIACVAGATVHLPPGEETDHLRAKVRMTRTSLAGAATSAVAIHRIVQRTTDVPRDKLKKIYLEAMENLARQSDRYEDALEQVYRAAQAARDGG